MSCRPVPFSAPSTLRAISASEAGSFAGRGAKGDWAAVHLLMRHVAGPDQVGLEIPARPCQGGRRSLTYVPRKRDWVKPGAKIAAQPRRG